MKSINLFEVGEAVYVKAVVTGMTIDHGEIKYHLKNDVTGRNYDHLFCGDQLYPSKTNDPIPKFVGDITYRSKEHKEPTNDQHKRHQ